MYSGGWYDHQFPRIRELIADTTVVPQPTTLGSSRKYIRQRESDGAVVWSDGGVYEDVRITNGLQYDPNAPPGAYFVMPVMYAPSVSEEQQMYHMGQNAFYEAQPFQEPMYTDVKTLPVEEADNNDDRLYYKEINNMVASGYIPPYVELKSYIPEESTSSNDPLNQSNIIIQPSTPANQSSIVGPISIPTSPTSQSNIMSPLSVPLSQPLSPITEPNITKPEPSPVICRDALGQCTCAKRRAAAQEVCKMAKCDDKQGCVEAEVKLSLPEETKLYLVPSDPDVTDAPKEFEIPSRSGCTEECERLYISVDTHTDNTIVDNKGIQTQKQDIQTTSATETKEAETSNANSSQSFEAAEAGSPPIPPSRTKKNAKKRTYPILTGQRKHEENVVIITPPTPPVAQTSKSLPRTPPPINCEEDCEPGKPCSPKGLSHLPTKTKKK